MKENGSMGNVMAMEYRNGLMAHGMRDSGALVRQTGKESCTMRTEIFMKENG